MRYFLQRNVTLISSLLAILFVTVFLLFILLLAAKEHRDAYESLDQPLVNLADLPGRKDQISDRTRQEIDVLLRKNPHIIGGYAAKIHYAKTENPVIHFVSKDLLVETAMANYDVVQKSGKGFSSAELDAASERSAANTEEAKTGVIRCGPLAATNIGKLAPGIEHKVKGVCRATIPPFDEAVNLQIIVLIDKDGMDQQDPAILELRRLLLQLQIDIYNRDFKGRETWIGN